MLFSYSIKIKNNRHEVTHIFLHSLSVVVVVLGLLCLSACSSVSSTPPVLSPLLSQQQPINSTAAEDNAHLGLMYLQAGDRQLAKEKLLLALQQDSQNSEIYGAMAYFLESSGELQSAEQYYLQAIAVAKAKDKGASYNNYGTYLYRHGRYSMAINYFLMAAQEPLYLHVAAAYENAGLTALSTKDIANARIYFKKALANDPNRELARRSLAKLG